MIGSISVTVPGTKGPNFDSALSTAVRAVTADATYHLEHGKAPATPQPFYLNTEPRGLELYLPSGTEYMHYLVYEGEARARKFAALIEHYGRAQGLDVRATVSIDPPARPLPTGNTETETCWECGCPIERGHGVLDVMGWAHRSCVGG